MLRYLLGNVHGFDIRKQGVSYIDLEPQDKYVLHLLHALITQVCVSFVCEQVREAVEF